MKTNFENRLKKLESQKKTNPGSNVSAIFVRYVHPGFIYAPVDGWKFGPWGEETEVLRNDGESDEDLKSRAIDLARKSLGVKVPTLTSIGLGPEK